MHERISVIIPVYNGERFLVEAIQSVAEQEPSPYEIIVVDDGSTDGTAVLAQKSGVKVRYLYQANQGPAAARNLGLEFARGDVIAFQDADDLWAPGRLAVQLAVLAQHPDAHAVIGRTQFFYMDAAPAEFTALAATMMAPHWLLGMHSGLYRRAAFERAGHFNGSLRYHEDLEWFRRARAAGLVIRPHADVVLLHRRHADNVTNNRVALQREYLRMLRQSPRYNTPPDESLYDWLTAGAAHGHGEESMHAG